MSALQSQHSGVGYHGEFSDDTLIPLCHIVTPTGMLGYGFEEDAVDDELGKLASTPVPTAIILDSGSTDSGPSKLALGTMTAPRSSYKRDLAKILTLVNKYKVPLLFSSAGGDGSNDHVDEMVNIIQEIVEEQAQRSRRLKVLAIYAEVPKTLVKERFESGQIQGCGSAVPPLTLEDIESAPRIVAQMGCEPFHDAMFSAPDFDIVIGGRAYDPSPFVAYTAFQAIGRSNQVPLNTLGDELLGGIFHMGKIMECGGVCATPKTKSIRSTVYQDGTFDVKPLHHDSKCTPLTVAAHTLYEKSRPDLLYGPGGCLDLTNSVYKQLPDKITVRVRGGLFKSPSSIGSKYTVKLEAARVVGYRSIFIGAIKDPILTAQVDSFLGRIQEYVKYQHKGIDEKWELGIHKFGATGGQNGEIFLVGETLAASQTLANSVASTARIACVHGPYPGQKATSGNFAMGLGGKLELETGPCTEFCIYHLMELSEHEEGAKEIKTEHEIKQTIINEERPAGRVEPLFSWKQLFVGEDETPAPINGHTNSGQSSTLVLSPTNGIVSQETKSEPVSNGTNGPPRFKPDDFPTKYATLGDIAGIVRSKNAGPFELTFDIMFDSRSVYHAVKNSGLLTPAIISKLYELNEDDIIYCGFFDQALAFKATIPRMRGGVRAASGGFMERDVHGSQHYLPLMALAIPSELAEIVKAEQA